MTKFKLTIQQVVSYITESSLNLRTLLFLFPLSFQALCHLGPWVPRVLLLFVPLKETLPEYSNNSICFCCQVPSTPNNLISTQQAPPCSLLFILFSCPPTRGAAERRNSFFMQAPSSPALMTSGLTSMDYTENRVCLLPLQKLVALSWTFFLTFTLPDLSQNLKLKTWKHLFEVLETPSGNSSTLRS